jgi:hypothetical protein
MSSNCSLHRLPRAGIDPIDSEPVALSLLGMVVSTPLRHETIVAFLDQQRRGISILVVNGTMPFDALFDVVDVVIDIGVEFDELGAVVLYTVRPPVAGVPDLDELDVDRWLEASAMLDDAGIELLEWFVVGALVTSPRDQLGEPPRWTGSRFGSGFGSA